MIKNTPRILISALKGGSGKTIITLGLASTFIEKNKKITTYKKGPDFIDAGWLSFASKNPCHNLDHFLMDKRPILNSIVAHSAGADLSLIEGNRGLFDGMNIDGKYSSAELAKLAKSPVIIIADVTMSTRTVAALIMGCQKFDPDLDIAGVILNRVAGSRQKNLVKESIERYCNIPVIGSVPKLKNNPFPERHMGLVPHFESNHAREAVKWAQTVVEDHIDTDLILKIAERALPIDEEEVEAVPALSNHEKINPCRIGIIHDRSFWFYYPENIEHLKELGAELVYIDSISDRKLPDIDALYIGGGFPEVCAEKLADNSTFRESLKNMIENNLPVYAECGGLIYLGKSVEMKGNSYPMVGALPIRFMMEDKPQGHGYTILKVKRENPYYSVGKTIKGHEFHYSRPVMSETEDIKTVFDVERGHCLDGVRDGFLENNLFATYTHIHSAGNRSWGEGFVRAAAGYRELVKKNTKI
ncbi:cobyrinate a,c-diamide synthase [Thermodesulfobacteriota bacterium]